MTNLLTSVVQEGTGKRAKQLGRPIAGKTGTSNQARDGWFVGYSTDIACAVWTGFDDPTPMGAGEAGASVALPAFVDFMKEAHRKRPPADFPVPAGITREMIDPAERAQGVPGAEGRDRGALPHRHGADRGGRARRGSRRHRQHRRRRGRSRRGGPPNPRWHRPRARGSEAGRGGARGPRGGAAGRREDPEGARGTTVLKPARPGPPCRRPADRHCQHPARLAVSAPHAPTEEARHPRLLLERARCALSPQRGGRRLRQDRARARRPPGRGARAHHHRHPRGRRLGPRRSAARARAPRRHRRAAPPPPHRDRRQARELRPGHLVRAPGAHLRQR